MKLILMVFMLEHLSLINESGNVSEAIGNYPIRVLCINTEEIRNHL